MRRRDSLSWFDHHQHNLLNIFIHKNYTCCHKYTERTREFVNTCCSPLYLLVTFFSPPFTVKTRDWDRLKLCRLKKQTLWAQNFPFHRSKAIVPLESIKNNERDEKSGEWKISMDRVSITALPSFLMTDEKREDNWFIGLRKILEGNRKEKLISLLKWASLSNASNIIMNVMWRD